MNQATFIDLVQSAAWLLTLVELIIALYILVLNSRDRAPLHLSGLLVVFAINSFAVGSLVVTQATWQAKLPTVLLAATSHMVGTGVLLTTAVMLRPRWFKARYRRMRWRRWSPTTRARTCAKCASSSATSGWIAGPRRWESQGRK